MSSYFNHRQHGGVGSPTVIASGILPGETGNQVFIGKLSLFKRSIRQIVKRYNDTKNYKKSESNLVVKEYIEILKQIDKHHLITSYDELIAKLKDLRTNDSRTAEIEAVNRFYFGKETDNRREFYLGLKGVVTKILDVIDDEQLSQHFMPASIKNFKAIVNRSQNIFVEENKNIINASEGTTI